MYLEINISTSDSFCLIESQPYLNVSNMSTVGLIVPVFFCSCPSDCMQTDSNHNELVPCAMSACNTYVDEEGMDPEYGLEDDWETFDP